MDDESIEFAFHLVCLDEHWPAAFGTTSRDKSELAVQILADAFGYDRVSAFDFPESNLDTWREMVRQWAADPRIASPQPEPGGAL